MATAPVADQQRILDVQFLDTRAQQLLHQRRTLPIHQAIAQLDSELADVDKALVLSRTEASDLRRELKKAESDVEQVRSRAARDQTRLDSGMVSAKDAQALVAELESLGRRQEALEEIELDVMERLEAHEKALSDIEAARESTVSARDAAVGERNAAVALIDAERKQVAAQRATAIAGVDVPLVAVYEKLRDQLGGLGAARLEGNRCGGCRMELNPTDLARIKSASPQTVVRCEECGRLLVRTAAQATEEL